MKTKTTIISLGIVLLLSLLLWPNHQPVSSGATVFLPNIPACTVEQLTTISVYLTDMTEDIDKLNTAIDNAELDEMKNLAIDLHQNWFQESPDIPYCAQGVHTRLLVDRMIEALVLTSLSMSYGDLDLADTYAEMIQTTAADLVTYGEILSSY